MSETSFLTILIYDDQEVAEFEGIQPEQFQVYKDISDLLVHEGAVKTFLSTKRVSMTSTTRIMTSQLLCHVT